MAEQLTRTRTTRRGSRRKTELLAASAPLFAQYGYHNVSMDDIAAAVGITGPALYRHFPNKHEVLVRAIDEQISSLEQLATRVLAEEADGETRFEAFLSALGQLVLDVHPVLLWKRERTHLNVQDEKAIRQRLRRVNEQSKKIILGIRPDLSDADATMLSWILQSLYSGTDEYRKLLDRAELADLLPRMARAAVSVDLASAPRVDHRMRPDYAFSPAGRRERVLDAAARLFSQRGYRAVSVEDIAEASDIAIATVYQLVGSKAKLLFAMMFRGSDGISYMTEHRLAFAPEDESPLETMVNTYIELACGPHIRLLKILAADSVYLEEDDQRAMRRSQREYIEDLVRALVQLRPDMKIGPGRARVHAAIGVISETVQIASIHARPNVEGEMRLLASAILYS